MNLYEIVIGYAIGLGISIGVCKLMYYEGKGLNWLRCKNAL